MKKIIFLFSIFFLISCSSLNNGKIAPGYFQAFDSITNLIFGYDNQIDPQIIEKIPFASIKVRIGNGPEALMILQRVNGDEYTWVSADEVYLVIKNGKIIKTQGLPNNLFENLTSFAGWNDVDILDKKEKFISYYSFKDPELNNLEVFSQYSNRGKTELQLTFVKKQLLLLNERISAESIGWEKINSYWLDDQKYVWRSVQHISPRLPPIYYEVTKKPL
tara:strand:- start:854 stop:1510 length:657 start_codon:yes stop_codon:yes gene_type:complete